MRICTAYARHSGENSKINENLLPGVWPRGEMTALSSGPSPLPPGRSCGFSPPDEKQREGLVATGIANAVVVVIVVEV